jgi:hypothetical protein
MKGAFRLYTPRYEYSFGWRFVQPFLPLPKGHFQGEVQLS